jgi:hypothetical protein
MKKPRKPSAEPVGWKVYIMRAKLTWLGFVEARDEHEALDKAMRDLNIREADRFRITAQRGVVALHCIPEKCSLGPPRVRRVGGALAGHGRSV